MTLNEMASAIRNNIGSGLREVGNFAYPLDQIKVECGNIRNAILLEDNQKLILNQEFFAQRIDNIELDLVQFPFAGYSNSPGLVPHIKLYRIAMTKDNSSIIYLGPPDMSHNIKVYYDFMYQNHQYCRVIGKRPYCYVDLAHGEDGKMDVYFFNLGATGLRYLSARCIFEEPVEIMEADGLFGYDEEFPAPTSVQELIIDRVTAKYVDYYKKLNHPYQPNTQTDQK